MEPENDGEVQSVEDQRAVAWERMYDAWSEIQICAHVNGFLQGCHECPMRPVPGPVYYCDLRSKFFARSVELMEVGIKKSKEGMRARQKGEG